MSCSGVIWNTSVETVTLWLVKRDIVFKGSMEEKLFMYDENELQILHGKWFIERLSDTVCIIIGFPV